MGVDIAKLSHVHEAPLELGMISYCGTETCSEHLPAAAFAWGVAKPLSNPESRWENLFAVGRR